MKIALVFGTRPEAIKMAPIVHATKGRCEAVVISTGQHREMIAPILSWFEIVPDRDLALMKPGQTPQDLLARAMPQIGDMLAAEKPDAVLVQGDTSTALAGALAAFHLKIPVGHVEAGLRTHDMYSPFPEEMNRQLIGRMASWHFAPTDSQAKNLRAENVPGEICVVGNPVVDALHWTSKRLGAPAPRDRPFILVTAHRRESFGEPIREAFGALRELAERYPGIDFIYPVHRNPNVFEPAREILGGIGNVKLVEPLGYPEMIDHLRQSLLVISDSGGVQEEAPSFGVPVLILRESTERGEIVEAGIGTLVGTSRDRILEKAAYFLDNPGNRAAVAKIPNPYGDGEAAGRIITRLLQSRRLHL